MHEDIVSFYSETLEDYPFSIEMAGISYCDGSYKIERNDSGIYCFEYIIKGQGTAVINEEVYTPIEGDIYILHRGSNHKYFSDRENPWVKIWFNIKGELVDHLVQAYKINKICYICDLNLKDLFFRFLSIAKSTENTTEEIFNKASVVFHEIMINIYRHTKATRKINSPTALALKEYIDKRVSENISIRELSELVYKSPSQTIRIFKREFGLTPYDYLLKSKIETAKLMLINTNLQINDIAMKLNFADEHYFSNYFKSKTGISPARFRNNTRISS